MAQHCMTSQPVAFCETVRQRYYRSTRSVNYDVFLLLAIAILSRLTSDFFLGYLLMSFTVPSTYLVYLAPNK